MTTSAKEIEEIVKRMEESSIRSRPLLVLGVIATLLGFVFTIFYLNQLRNQTEIENESLRLRVEELTKTIDEAQNIQLRETAKGEKSTSELAEVLADASNRVAVLERDIPSYPKKAGSSETVMSTGSGRVKNAPTSRIYLHISDEAQRVTAARFGVSIISEDDDALRLVVPGVQLIKQGGDNSLRCFSVADCATAQNGLLSFLNGKLASPKVHLADFSKRYGNSSLIRPGHYEIWFGADPIVLAE